MYSQFDAGMCITLHKGSCLPNVFMCNTYTHTHIYIYMYINIPRWHIGRLHSKVAIFSRPYFLTYFSVKNIRTIYYVTSQKFAWALCLCYQIYGTENCRVLFWNELLFTYSFKENVLWQTRESDWWQELHLTIDGRNGAQAHKEMMMSEVTYRVKRGWLPLEINWGSTRLSLWVSIFVWTEAAVCPALYSMSCNPFVHTEASAVL
jgi:hypothetical protein